MSVRVYTGPHSARRTGPSGAVTWIPWVLAGLTVLAQIVWPLTSGDARTTVTVVVVLLFASASASHAWIHRGFGWMLGWLVLSTGVGTAAEVVGTRTGLPFGVYAYAEGVLGPTVLGVPVVIALAWAMMSYPALLVGRRLRLGPGHRAVGGGVRPGLLGPVPRPADGRRGLLDLDGSLARCSPG